MVTDVQTFRPTLTLKVKQIALPTEHGGWGFLLEPMVAGLVIAFSVTGVWIAVMFVGAFLMRQPLKTYVLNRRGIGDERRAAVSIKYLSIYAVVFVAGVAGTGFTGTYTTLWPLIAMLPLAAVLTFHDIYRRSRNLVPELAGAVAISSSVAAITLAGGQQSIVAVGLWLLFIGRLVPSIIYVRQRLLLEKGKPFSAVTSTVVHVVAALTVAILAYLSYVPILTVPVMVIMLGRSVLGLSPKRVKLTAREIGIREVIYGAVLVLATITGHFSGL
jgi:hypothetical protein